jgi:hypothetical protein
MDKVRNLFVPDFNTPHSELFRIDFYFASFFIKMTYHLPAPIKIFVKEEGTELNYTSGKRAYES